MSFNVKKYSRVFENTPYHGVVLSMISFKKLVERISTVQYHQSLLAECRKVQKEVHEAPQGIATRTKHTLVGVASGRCADAIRERERLTGFTPVFSVKIYAVRTNSIVVVPVTSNVDMLQAWMSCFSELPNDFDLLAISKEDLGAATLPILKFSTVPAVNFDLLEELDKTNSSPLLTSTLTTPLESWRFA